MEKILIYGTGKVFADSFLDSDFAPARLREEGHIIAGVTDKQISRDAGRGKYRVLPREEALRADYDKILVTSTKYYDEIKQELLAKGIPAEKICSYKDQKTKWFAKLFRVSELKGKAGLEIGGPTEMFFCIYRACLSCDDVNFSANTVWWQKGENDGFSYDGRELGKVYIADAVDLRMIPDQSYDFVLSSNNLEHIANPIRALKEWRRVMRNGGSLVLVVPRREVTFDHDRPYTPFEHLLQDYESGIGEDDLSHLPEIRELHDYAMDVACGGKEKFLARAQKNFENRCLHHHVFGEDCLKDLWDYLGLDMLDFVEIPGNYCIVGKK